MNDSKTDWRAANRANWDERVSIHLKAKEYDLTSLRAGQGRLAPIEEAELGSLDGLRVLHLQCHFGRDSLILAQRGAEVVGLDFSGEAIKAAETLAGELGLADRARFIQSDLYAAREAIAEPAAFDRVFVTWGAINWLPDIVGWAGIVAHFLKPGGALYLLEGHPTAFVFDDQTKTPDGRPGFLVPYFSREPYIEENQRDYTGDFPALHSGPTYEWAHPLGSIVTALCDAGLRVRWLHEHDAVPWPAFSCLSSDGEGMWRWPDQPWLPLSFSLWAERP